MPRVGFEPTIPVSEREKMVHALDRASTVIGSIFAINVFARSNTGVVGSNPTRGMYVCVRLFCVCAVLCVGSGLAKA
jgi:hypothetical protein